jgi:hypothetical protein
MPQTKYFDMPGSTLEVLETDTVQRIVITLQSCGHPWLRDARRKPTARDIVRARAPSLVTKGWLNESGWPGMEPTPVLFHTRLECRSGS